jgi:hypothetical protein
VLGSALPGHMYAATGHDVTSDGMAIKCWSLRLQTVLRSDITRTILPGPASSTSYVDCQHLDTNDHTFLRTFSCQLRNTLMACPPPSAPPKFLPPACEKPLACGVTFLLWFAAGCDVPCAMPLYKYFMRVSHNSEPPSPWYRRCNKGVISACRIWLRHSVTTLKWTACNRPYQSLFVEAA